MLSTWFLVPGLLLASYFLIIFTFCLPCINAKIIREVVDSGSCDLSAGWSQQMLQRYKQYLLISNLIFNIYINMYMCVYICVYLT